MLARIEQLSMLSSVPSSGRIRMRPLRIRAPSRFGHGLGFRGATHRDGICGGIKQLGLLLVGGYRFLRGG